jgi:hypothetical protein
MAAATQACRYHPRRDAHIELTAAWRYAEQVETGGAIERE